MEVLNLCLFNVKLLFFNSLAEKYICNHEQPHTKIILHIYLLNINDILSDIDTWVTKLYSGQAEIMRTNLCLKLSFGSFFFLFLNKQSNKSVTSFIKDIIKLQIIIPVMLLIFHLHLSFIFPLFIYIIFCIIIYIIIIMIIISIIITIIAISICHRQV